MFVDKNEYWRRTLAYGQKFEKLAQARVLNYMFQKYNKTCKVIEECNDNRYDFKIEDTATKQTYTFEVKADRASKRTNNFFIEFLNKDKLPSGLSTTLANFYIITDEENYYTLTVQQLKHIIANTEQVRIKHVYKKFTSGTQLTAVGYVIDKNVFIKQAISI